MVRGSFCTRNYSENSRSQKPSEPTLGFRDGIHQKIPYPLRDSGI